MTAWAWVGLAVLASLGTTTSLRLNANEGTSRLWLLASLVAIVLSLALVSQALAAGMPLAIAYGAWTAGSIALGAIGARIMFGERLTLRQIGGLALILGGTLATHLGAGP